MGTTNDMIVLLLLTCVVGCCTTNESDPGRVSGRARMAYAVPRGDTALDALPVSTLSDVSRVPCLAACTERNCSSFNYGARTCEMFNTFLCAGVHSLTTRMSYKYYDVEDGLLLHELQPFHQHSDCTTKARCSPKCYSSTITTTTDPPTSTAAPPTTTTDTPTTTTDTPTTTTDPPTTTTDPPTTTTDPPTTTTDPPTTTTDPPTTTTDPPTTTTDPPTTTADPPTTTTDPPTTTTDPPTTTTDPPTTTTDPPTTTTDPPTTTTDPPTTTTDPPTTTTDPPTTTTYPPTTTTRRTLGVGDVGHECLQDLSCTTANSDCRTWSQCLCVAGYSYNFTTHTCDTHCPRGYGLTYHETEGYHLAGQYLDSSSIDPLTSDPMEECFANCRTRSMCITFEFDMKNNICHFGHFTKLDRPNSWEENPLYFHAQRNCLQ